MTVHLQSRALGQLRLGGELNLMAGPASAEARLLDRAKRGEAQAVAELYETYVDRIYRYIAYRVNNDEDAEDLTAEVFVKMVEKLPVYEDRGAPFEAGLYRIASARIIDMRRRNDRRPQQELDESLYSGEAQPEQEMVEEAEREELRAALAQLSQDDQTILILRFVERKSHQEVADVLNKTMTAVKSAQHRALTRLAKLLGEDKVRHYMRGQSDD